MKKSFYLLQFLFMCFVNNISWTSVVVQTINNYADDIHTRRLNHTTQNLEDVQNFYDIVSGVNGNTINYSKNIPERARMDQRRSFIRGLYESINVDKEHCFTKLSSAPNNDKFYMGHLKALYNYMFFAYIMNTTPVSCLWTVNDLLNELDKTDQNGNYFYEIYLDQTNLVQKTKIKEFFKAEINNRNSWTPIAHELINIYKEEFMYAHLNMPDVEYQDILQMVDYIKNDDVNFYKMSDRYKLKVFGQQEKGLFKSRCMKILMSTPLKEYSNRQYNGFTYMNCSNLESEYDIIDILIKDANERTLEIIKEISNKGEKVGLFIGRNAQEKTPNDYEQDVRNFPEDKDLTWVTLSDDRDSLEAFFPSSSSNRLQINRDIRFNRDGMESLFNKIVIDSSTLKGLINENGRLNFKDLISFNYKNDPLYYLFLLLKHEQDSTLMFQLDHLWWHPEVRIKPGIDEEFISGRFINYIFVNKNTYKQNPEAIKKKAYEIMISRIKKLAEVMFNDVKIYDDKKYYTCTEKPTEYFVLKKPKSKDDVLEVIINDLRENIQNN